MLVSNGVLLHIYQPAAAVATLLGRHLELDARSLSYTVEATLRDELLRVPIKPVQHQPAIPILDQSDLHSQGIHVDGNPDGLGSCTGNAGTYAISALASTTQRARFAMGGYHLADGERFAIALYHAATVEDGLQGTWPPSDEGSTGLGVCRALKAANLVDRYTWATTVHGLGVLMQTTGVLLGTPWVNAFFEPDVHGFIDHDPRWAQSGVAGGHEIYLGALEAWDAQDPSRSVVAFPNSWSTSWGDHGWGRMRLSTYVALRQQCDVKQFHVREAA